MLKDTTLSTFIANGKAQVQTVEHLLAALTGMGVDNAVVELDAPEVPIMDGSAMPFVHLIRRAGLTVQHRPRTVIKITKAITVTDGDKRATLLPSGVTSIAGEIDFSHPLIRQQRFEYVHTTESFVDEIANARTFGFKKDIDYLVRQGLARGGSLDNAVLLDENGIVNEGGLRFEDEFVRHKILDAIGDLTLAGYPILGRLEMVRSGHALNGALVEALLSTPGSWTMIHEERRFQSRPAAMEPALAFMPRMVPA
jgi:UDP-3-O-[3-hydroxymyristoyl] N-acetylglucosamine deacetylase